MGRRVLTRPLDGDFQLPGASSFRVDLEIGHFLHPHPFRLQPTAHGPAGVWVASCKKEQRSEVSVCPEPNLEPSCSSIVPHAPPASETQGEAFVRPGHSCQEKKRPARGRARRDAKRSVLPEATKVSTTSARLDVARTNTSTQGQVLTGIGAVGRSPPGPRGKQSTCTGCR